MSICSTPLPQLRLAATALAIALGITLVGPVAAQDDGMLMAPEGAGTTTEPEVFQDWAMRCEQPGGPETRACYAYHRVLMEETDQAVLSVAVGFAPDGEAAMLVLLPLGVNLPPGLLVRVDEGEELAYQYDTCLPRGCQTILLLDDDLLGQFRRGLAGEVTFMDLDGRTIGVSFPLTGFTAAFNAAREAR